MSSILIKNILIHTVEGPDIKGDIFIKDGKIALIKDSILENADMVIDGKGLHAWPGLIDAHNHIGIYEEIIGDRGDDVNEMSDPITPQMRGIDGVNPREMCFDDARKAGITTVATGPGSANVIGGTFVALKTLKRNVIDDMVIKDPIAMKAALGENPKMVYRPRNNMPYTRMAETYLMREAFQKTLEYIKKKEIAKDDPSKMPEWNGKWEALIPVLKGEIPLKVHAHRADDIARAIKIAREFNIKITLDHVMDGHIIADYIKKAHDDGVVIGVILGPYMTDRFKPEVANSSFKTPSVIAKHGILFALMTDHPVVPIQHLTTMAIYSVAAGLPEEEAIKAITINPAKILGIDDKVGSIKEGKDADIIITTGNILDPYNKVIYTIINGEISYQEGVK